MSLAVMKEILMHEKFDLDDRLLTDIKKIDNDHIKFFAIINNFLREAEGNKTLAAISATI